MQRDDAASPLSCQVRIRGDDAAAPKRATILRHPVRACGPIAELAAGDTVRLTLTFKRAGSVAVDAPVRVP
jgi:hypothetical protein